MDRGKEKEKEDKNKNWGVGFGESEYGAWVLCEEKMRKKKRK